ncbi:MAG: efflux RND transporter periplasmic adaptor subunit [Gemmatimonadota bacterium]|jgi:membrane fusion protein (multidrug efflux system)
MNRIAAIGIVAASALAASGCSQTEGAEAQPSQENTVRTINVEVAAVQPGDFTHFVRVVGTVEAERDVRVSAEEGGVVEALGAEKGEVVRPGEVLLRIDDDVLRAQLEQAASQAELAEETWQRQRQLWEQDSIGTEIAYLQAQYNARTARAQAQVLDERVQRTAVRAPVAGILDERSVEVGSMVAAGTPVARILDVDTVKIVGGVPERYASDIAPGSEVTVIVSALGGREYRGTIDFVGSAVDAGNRTFPVEVMVPNPGLGIKPGMVADVQIAQRAIEGALTVPRYAVLRREDGYVVYVARQEGDDWRAETRTVVPGVSRGESVVIEQGLQAGERVIVVGQQQVAEGDVLRITDAGGMDTAAPMEPVADDAVGAADGEGGEG